jgi:hypothetical protein
VCAGRWLDGTDAGCSEPLLHIDVILTFVFYGVALTVLLNTLAVARHVAREGLPAFLPPVLLVELPVTFLLLMGGVAAWLFSPGTKKVAQEHWALTCGVATVLSVELNTRVMLAFTARDTGVLSRFLHVRALAFATVPLWVHLGWHKSLLGAEPQPFCAGALLAAGVVAVLPCARFIFAACTQVAAALGIATFSIAKPANAAASSESTASGSERSKSVSRGKSPAKGSSTSSAVSRKKKTR